MKMETKVEEKPTVCVLRTDGTNCDRETKYAFNQVGADAKIIHLKSLINGFDVADEFKRPITLDDFDIWAIPGGFSYGDYNSAAKIFAEDLKHYLGNEIQKFVDDKKPIIGICNGFQVLVKYGLLPNLDNNLEQTVTLTDNNNKNNEDSRNFQCRWVNLVKPLKEADKCIWTKNVDKISLPIAHAEGKFVADESLCKKLYDEGLVVFQYADKNHNPTLNFPDNPNGSALSIAGICDKTGLIFGLMPHPERYNSPENHPDFQRQKILNRDYINEEFLCYHELLKEVGPLPEKGLGLQIFKNAVDYVLKNKE